MEPEVKKQRIEYIDLMKGFCIIVVVAMHCNLYTNVDLIDTWVSNFRMPLYFFLSGLFFKKYSGFTEFLVHKVNKVLIPYFFFSWIPYCALSFLFTSNFTNPLFWLFAPIMTYNGVLWFLKSLFIAHLFFYLFVHLTQKTSEALKVVILFIITLVNVIVVSYAKNFAFMEGYYFITYSFFSAVMSLPFMYVANIIMRHHLLNKEMTKRQEILLIISSLAIALVSAQHSVWFNIASFGDHFIFMYISALSSIFALLIICRWLTKLPYVSYVGRYSLIVLGTHFAYLTIIRHYVNWPPYIEFVIILILMPPSIWLFKKFFPYFTAQKELIKYKKIG